MRSPSKAKAPESAHLWSRVGGATTLLLLVLTAIGACTFDRDAWPGFIGDEATYLMAAESLAWDGDLTYERHDYERFVERWQRIPEGLILQSGDGGQSITFGKPFFYPLFLAPFVRLMPERGAFVGNFVLLALAAAGAWSGLRPRLGAATSTYIGALLFASVTFASVFWLHADLLLLCCVSLGLSLGLPRRSTRSGDAEETRSAALPWLLAGLLLAIVAYSRPFYAGLLLPLVALQPAGARIRRSSLVAAGAIALTLASGAVHHRSAGSWTSYGGERHGFYSYTGFPHVDFPAARWRGVVEEIGNAAWLGTMHFVEHSAKSPELARANLLYFFLGRHVGIVPYFLPVLLIFAGRGPDRRRRWLLAAAVLGAIAFLLARPFNFYGGGAAIANRYFLPLYAGLWFALPRGARAKWALAAALLAAPFLLPLWTAPRAYPAREDSTLRYVSRAARGLLPYETTLEQLKPAGREDVIHHGLWIKFLTPTAGATEGDLLFAVPSTDAEYLIGSGRPLTRLELEADAIPQVEGAVASVVRPGTLALDLGKPTTRHPMWWTWNDFYLYHLTVRFEGDPEGGAETFTLATAPRVAPN